MTKVKDMHLQLLLDTGNPPLGMDLYSKLAKEYNTDRNTVKGLCLTAMYGGEKDTKVVEDHCRKFLEIHGFRRKSKDE